MAEATISIERVAHDCMRELAERLARDHGLRITGVHFTWDRHFSSMRIVSTLTGVQVETESDAA